MVWSASAESGVERQNSACPVVRANTLPGVA